MYTTGPMYYGRMYLYVFVEGSRLERLHILCCTFDDVCIFMFYLGHWISHPVGPTPGPKTLQVKPRK